MKAVRAVALMCLVAGCAAQSIDEQVGFLRERQDLVVRYVTVMYSRQGTHAKDLEALKKGQAGNAAGVAAVETELTAQAAELAAAKKELASMKAAVAAQKKEMAAELAALKKEIQKVAAAKPGTPAAPTGVAALRTDVAALKKESAEQASELEAVKAEAAKQTKRLNGNIWGLKELKEKVEAGAGTAPTPPSGGGGGNYASAIDQLTGVVAAMGRQLVSNEIRTEQRLRAEGQSGLTIVRAPYLGTKSYYQASYAGNGAANMHNHADHLHTIGLGEFGAVLNGVQFSTRHNDYGLLQADPSLSAANYVKAFPPKSSKIAHPSVPPSVLNKKTVEEQIKEMREYFRAFQKQDKRIRDYTKYFKANICFLEGAWTEAKETLAEPFESERHHVDASTWAELTEKANFLFNSGRKSNLENLPYLPTSFRGMGSGKDTHVPRLGQWFYRINCQPVKGEVPTGRFRVRDDLHIQLREATPNTREELAEKPRAMFDLHPNRDGAWKATSPWPKSKTTYEYLDDLMAQVPGFDGPKANIRDNSLGLGTNEYKTKTNEALNTGFYSRYYNVRENDAMGRSDRKRGFNDNFWAAQTTNKRVSPLSVCESVTKKPFTKEQDTRVKVCGALRTPALCGGHAGWPTVGGTESKCRFVNNKCRYSQCWTQRWTYAIPLEIVYMTPLSSWDPYNIGFATSNADVQKVKAGGRNGKEDKPYNGASTKVFFRTPAAFFKEPKNGDAADTGTGVTYVLDKSGKKRAVRASGHWIKIPEIDGVGSVRQRYPIFPVHEHGSAAWKEVKALQELVVGKNDPKLKEILQETRSEAYGVELIIGGGGHSHSATIPPNVYLAMKAGTRASYDVATNTGNGHQHFIRVNYARNTDTFSLGWCTATGARKACPKNVLAGKACGTANGVRCCPAKCPDGHSFITRQD